MLYKHSGDQTGKVRDALARASEGPDGIKNRNQVKKSTVSHKTMEIKDFST